MLQSNIQYVNVTVSQTTNVGPVITNPTSINFSNPLPTTIGPFVFSAADSDGISNMIFIPGSILPSGYFTRGPTSFDSVNNTFSIFLNKVTTKTAADFVSVTGGFSFKVRATDTCTAFTDSTYTFFVVNTGPTVQITSPSNPTSLTLPIISQSITAVATDPDQSTFTYNWSLSGPSTAYTFTPNNSTSGTTILSGLNKGGTHVVTVSVTDNSGSTSTSTLTLNVTDPNPEANAGSRQEKTYAANTSWPKQFRLTGSGTDPNTNGYISAYSWRIITNPGNAASLVSPSSSTTAVNISTFGLYKFGLIVTDNNGNTSSEATVEIELISDAPPTVNLVTSTSDITLPINSVTLTATTTSDVTSLDIIETNSYSGYTVTEVSNGPTTWTRTISGLIPNTNGTPRTYSFVAKAYDAYQNVTSNSVNVVVNNQAPTAQVFLPSTTITDVIFNNSYSFGITGFANDPDGGSLTSPTFTCDAFPSTYTGNISFTNPTISSTSGAGTTYSSTCTLAPRLIPSGTGSGYTFSFRITDDEGQTVISSQKNLAFVNSSPTITQTTRTLVQNFELPSFNTSLFGITANDTNDPSGPLTFTWSASTVTKPTGAGTPNIPTQSPSDGKIDIFFTNPQIGGTYGFNLIVRDPNSYAFSQSYTIKRNVIPTATITSPAIDGTSITLPVNTVSLASSASDSDGFISTYAWSITAKPTGSSASLSSTSVSNPTLTVDLAGSYTVQLIVTDNNGRQSTAVTRQITVNANPAPYIDSFTATPTSVTISNGFAGTSLTVSATDPNSQPLTYNFTQTLPASPLATILAGSGTSANTATVSGMTVPFSSSNTPSSRTYTFKVDVSDGTNTASSTTNVVVNSSAPTINVNNPTAVTWTGSSQSITLAGSGSTASDPDGGVLTYQWSYVSGPAGAATPSISNGTNFLSASASGFDRAGTYTFKIRATDDEGTFVEKNDVTVTLNNAVTPTVAFNSTTPVVVANGTTTYSGFSVKITNASTSNPCNLTFSISPSNATITNKTYSNITNNALNYSTGTISNLSPGTTYTISATATNPSTLATGSTSPNPTLRQNALPITPLPSGPSTGSSGTKLTYTITGGSATDSDGSITNYLWSTTPSTSTISPNNTPTATTVGITFNADSVYTIKYIATDTDGGTSTSGNFTTTISTVTDVCALKNYARSGANLQAYNLIIPNSYITGTAKALSGGACVAVATPIKFSAGNPTNTKFDYLANEVATALSWKINPTLPTGNDNTGTKWPYSNFILRHGNFISYPAAQFLIEDANFSTNPSAWNYGFASGDGYHTLLRGSDMRKVTRPFDLSFAHLQNAASTPVSVYTNLSNYAAYKNRVKEFVNNDYTAGFQDSYGGDKTFELSYGIPFIFKCSCWDDATDTLVYTNWYSYVNQTGTQNFNLSCPQGSTRKPRSLIVVRYRQSTAMGAFVTTLTGGENIVNSTYQHSLSDGSAIISTDITAYYVSIDTTVSRVGTSDQCKLGIGRYRLVRYEVNYPKDLTNDGALTLTNCSENAINTGTCVGSANQFTPVGTGSKVTYTTTLLPTTLGTNVPEVCDTCSVNTTVAAGYLKERTWANAQVSNTASLGLALNTAWQPPEWICVADCENPSYAPSGNCITTMIESCAPPSLFTSPENVPPIINSSGNDNLVYIKIYNTEDPTQYECVPVLYDPDLIKQYELCES